MRPQRQPAGSQGTLGGPNKTLKLAAVSKGLGRYPLSLKAVNLEKPAFP